MCVLNSCINEAAAHKMIGCTTIERLKNFGKKNSVQVNMQVEKPGGKI
jgi:hypothetical protein